MLIRLGDWRDHRPIDTLRKQGDGISGGGLYELLTWPVYHVHTARRGDEIIGFTSVALFPDGTADDCGTVVAEAERGRGIASALRGTQVRDLLVMGWRALYVAVSETNAPGQGCARAHFGEPIGTMEVEGLTPMAYFGDGLATIQARLTTRGTTPPHPLSPPNLEKLRQKAALARQDLARLDTVGRLAFQKAALRQGLVHV